MLEFYTTRKRIKGLSVAKENLRCIRCGKKIPRGSFYYDHDGPEHPGVDGAHFVCAVIWSKGKGPCFLMNIAALMEIGMAKAFKRKKALKKKIRKLKALRRKK